MFVKNYTGKSKGVKIKLAWPCIHVYNFNKANYTKLWNSSNFDEICYPFRTCWTASEYWKNDICSLYTSRYTVN